MSVKIISSNNKDGYDAWSSFYDNFPNPTVAVDELHFPKRWAHLTSQDILEVGCGTGRHTSKLIKQSNRVVGIDISPGMLEIARKRLSDAALLINADFLTFDELPIAHFNALVTSLVIEHVRDLDTFFKKSAAVLKTGGTCFISEIHPDKAARGGRANFIHPTLSQQIYLESYPHSETAILRAASAAGFSLLYSADILGDENLGQINSEWQKYINLPMIKIWELMKH